MLKKLSIIFLALIMIIMITACGSTGEAGQNDESAEAGSSETMTGGWELFANEANALPEDVQAAFDKATETFTGSELKPVAYVASQVVAGTNYAVLVEGELASQEPVSNIQVAVIYEDLDGNVELTNICTLDPADFNQ